MNIEKSKESEETLIQGIYMKMILINQGAKDVTFTDDELNIFRKLK